MSDEAATGAPGGVPVGLLLAGLSAAYLGVAAVVALYLLPIGFGLEGDALLLGQAGVVVGGAALVAGTAHRIVQHRRRRALLAATARACGWIYRADVSDRPWGGSIDEQIDRDGRTATDLIDARHTTVPFDSVERTFVSGEGEGSTVHAVRTVRIPLPAEAPRITIRSRRGGGALSLLPRRPVARSKLRLEGDFSDVFEVSVAPGYETDALYVLTPDLMAVLLDTSADLDLEVVDGTLHVYLPPVDLTDGTVREALLLLIGVLSERFDRRTVLYRDEAAPRLDPTAPRRSGDTLSAGARRLDTRARIGAVLAAVLTPLVPLVIAIVWVRLAG